MKKPVLKNVFKYLKVFLFLCAFFLNASSVKAEEIALDMPDFSNIKNSAKEFLNKSKQKVIILKDKSGEKLDVAKEKIDATKEKAGNKILQKTGKPTGSTPRGLTRKEREELILKYQDKGYYGTLPNIEREFDYIKQKSKKTTPGGKYKDTFFEENLKKAPLDDELFLDVILKKEKDTQFTKDILKMIPILNNFKNCIENSCNIQRFNANVNTVDLYVKRLEKDYGGTKDSNTEGFYLVQNIAYLAKLQGNLKYEANFYSKYMPLTGTVYSKENIEKKDYELLIELNKTIFALEQLK